jgi:zinc protease
MRNPAPVILTLFLAAVAAFLIFRKPEPVTPLPPGPTEVTEDAVDPPPQEDPLPVMTDTITPRAWPQAGSDLTPDSNAIFGHLENGMRYVIYPNSEPPERVSLRLHIDAGSLMEQDDQRGIAHFLEHMVFNGSKNFTPDELIPRMQRLGIAFGAHVNAYTSFDETVYMLDLPDLSDEMLKLGMTVMRDFCDGALLEIEEIDKERGVILSEKTSRDSVSYRLMEQQFSTLIPDSLITKRFPIGTEEVIRTAPRERFVDFYQKYYTPARMTFVMVGDIDPEQAKQRIEATFGALTNPEVPGSDPDLGAIEPTEGFEALIFSDKEVPSTELGLLSIEDFVAMPDTRENRVAKLPLSMAHAILGVRFSEIAKEDGSPILGGSASRQDLFREMTLGSIDVSVADDRWQDAVPVLEQQFRRALSFGFTRAEVAEIKANILNTYEQAVRTKDTRRSDGLATSFARSINDERVLTAPEADLEMVAAALESITAETCHAAFREFWDNKGVKLILTTKAKPEDGEELLASLYQKSSETEVTPPEETELKSFAYTEFGEAGTVTTTEQAEDLGITRLVLDNGVAVNLKPTDFDKDRVLIQARIGDGKLTLPSDKPGLGDFATAVIEGGGIGEHSADELRQILAGKTVSFGFSVEDDYFSLAGETTPNDLALQLQLMTAQLLHPGYREEAISQFRKTVPMIFQQLKHTTAGPMQKMSGWLRGGDPRFSFPDSPKELLAYEKSDIEEWLAKEFTNGTLELNIVGDFKMEEIIPLILSTFGAIEHRPAASELAAEARQVEFPEAPATQSYTYESKIPQGQAVVIWKTPGPRNNQKVFRRLNLLGEIFGDRLREEIREKLGAAYSPQAGVGGSNALDDFGYLIALVTSTPEAIPQLTELSVKLAETLAKDGASADELERARKPVLADLEKTLRDNNYWLGNVLSGSHADPEKLELCRNRQSDVESITIEELNELAAKYLIAENALQVVMVPESKEED